MKIISTPKNATSSPRVSIINQAENNNGSTYKFAIPPPMSLPPPLKLKESDSSNFEEDPEKAKFLRFLKMVERKNEAAVNRQVNS